MTAPIEAAKIAMLDAMKSESFDASMRAAIEAYRAALWQDVSADLKRAFSLGQIYWGQADSHSYSENRRAIATHTKFHDLLSKYEPLPEPPKEST